MNLIFAYVIGLPRETLDGRAEFGKSQSILGNVTLTIAITQGLGPKKIFFDGAANGP